MVDAETVSGLACNGAAGWEGDAPSSAKIQLVRLNIGEPVFETAIRILHPVNVLEGMKNEAFVKLLNLPMLLNVLMVVSPNRLVATVEQAAPPLAAENPAAPTKAASRSV